MWLVDVPSGADPAAHLALEEFCVKIIAPGSDLLLVYVNPPAVIVGRHQVPPAETDPVFLKSKGIDLLRRLSGGGAVFHDRGNINFAFVTGYDRRKFHNYRHFLSPVVEVLGRLGIESRFTPPNAVFIGGGKISGSAQFSDMHRMITHGTLLYRADLALLQNALRPAAGMIESRGVPSAKSPVANAGESLSDAPETNRFRDRFSFALAQVLGGCRPLTLAEDQCRQVASMARRYRSWQWTWGRSPTFVQDVVLSRKGGQTRVRLSVEGGTVVGAVHADRPGAPLAHLIGRRYDDLLMQA